MGFYVVDGREYNSTEEVWEAIKEKTGVELSNVYNETNSLVNRKLSVRFPDEEEARFISTSDDYCIAPGTHTSNANYGYPQACIFFIDTDAKVIFDLCGYFLTDITEQKGSRLTAGCVPMCIISNAGVTKDLVGNSTLYSQSNMVGVPQEITDATSLAIFPLWLGAREEHVVPNWYVCPDKHFHVHDRVVDSNGDTYYSVGCYLLVKLPAEDSEV